VTGIGNEAPVAIAKRDLVGAAFGAREAPFVDQPVVVPAQLYQVIQTGLTTTAPVGDVMTVDVVLARAPWKSTPLVPGAQGAPHGGWNDPGFPADIEGVSVPVFADNADRGVTAHPPRRFRGNMGAIFEMISPREKLSLILGRSPSALATRTFSRAAFIPMPHRQFSPCAQEHMPSISHRPS
jgi:hypothetical protein